MHQVSIKKTHYPRSGRNRRSRNWKAASVGCAMKGPRQLSAIKFVAASPDRAARPSSMRTRVKRKKRRLSAQRRACYRICRSAWAEGMEPRAPSTCLRSEAEASRERTRSNARIWPSKPCRNRKIVSWSGSSRRNLSNRVLKPIRSMRHAIFASATRASAVRGGSCRSSRWICQLTMRMACLAVVRAANEGSAKELAFVGEECEGPTPEVRPRNNPLGQAVARAVGSGCSDA